MHSLLEIFQQHSRTTGTQWSCVFISDELLICLIHMCTCVAKPMFISDDSKQAQTSHYKSPRHKPANTSWNNCKHSIFRIFCVYGAYSDGKEQSQIQKQHTMYKGKHNNKNNFRVHIDPFTSHLKRTLCIQS